MRKSGIGCVFLLLFLFSAQTVYAVGALFTRPLRSSQTYEKMWIKSVDATISIEGRVAVTHVDQVFHNEMNQQVEGIYIFPLPEGAVITELYYWFNGDRYKANIREREEARNAYNKKLRQYLDPALLEYLGDNLFRLSIAPINANSDVRAEITYVEMLPYEFGAVNYKFLLNSTGLSTKPLLRVSVSGEVKTDNPIKYLVSPSHSNPIELGITKISDTHYTVVFGDENFTPGKDLTLEYETERENIDINMLTYTPTPEDSIGNDSFYAIWITPPDSITDEEVIPKKIVFTADLSSSMDGLRLCQLKEALLLFLDHLSPDDKFNIVTFGTNVNPYRPDLVPATFSEIESAKSFVTELGAAGLTNIDDALSKSLALSFSPDFKNMIVFITDGYPTWGETSIPKILANARANNTNDVSIFSFGVGEDISKTLLVQLSLENNGYHTFIKTDDDISRVIGNHFRRISKPVLADLNINLGMLVTSDNFPRPLPDLFWGSQVLQLGLYHNAGMQDVILSGTVRGDSVSFETTAEFEKTPGKGHRFVPRLWASAKINYLLAQIDIYGELDELVNQVIDLSLRFQILTPYTALYADPDDPGTGVDDSENNRLIKSFALHQNYPNPFNPATTINFELPQNGYVILKIFDITGRLVRVLISESKQIGFHTIQWDGTDMNGRHVAAGIYVYQLVFQSNDSQQFVQTRKMSLVK